MTTRTSTNTGNRLSDMVYDEVSLVTRGANQDSLVVLFKADVDNPSDDPDEGIHEPPVDPGTLTNGNNVHKETKMPTGTDTDNQAPDLSGLPDEVQKSLSKYIDTLQKSNDVLQKDNETLAATLSEFVDEDGNPIVEEDDDLIEDATTLDVTKMDAGEIAKLDPVMQSIVKQAQDSARRAEAAETIAKAEQTRREQAESVDLAKSLTTHVGTDNGVLATALLDIKKNCAEATHAMITETLRSANEIAKSGTPVGSTNGDDNGTDVSKAAGALEAKRDEIMKADPNISKEAALVKVATENPDLYAEYVQNTHR